MNEEFGDKPRRRLWVEMEIAGNSGLLVGCLQVVDVEIADFKGEYQVAKLKFCITRANISGLRLKSVSTCIRKSKDMVCLAFVGNSF